MWGTLDFIFWFGFPKHGFSFPWYSRNYLIHMGWHNREGRSSVPWEWSVVPSCAFRKSICWARSEKSGAEGTHQIGDAFHRDPWGWWPGVCWGLTSHRKLVGSEQDWRKGPGLQDSVGKGWYSVLKNPFFRSTSVYGLGALASLGFQNFSSAFFFKSCTKKWIIHYLLLPRVTNKSNILHLFLSPSWPLIFCLL